MKHFVIAAILLGASCVQRPATPTASPPVESRPVGTAVVSRPIADTLMHIELRDALARAAAAALLVDTIVVSPTRLELRVGETIPNNRLHVEGRDVRGKRVDDFAPI